MASTNADATNLRGKVEVLEMARATNPEVLELRQQMRGMVTDVLELRTEMRELVRYAHQAIDGLRTPGSPVAPDFRPLTARDQP